MKTNESDYLPSTRNEENCKATTGTNADILLYLWYEIHAEASRASNNDADENNNENTWENKKQQHHGSNKLNNAIC